MPDVTVIVPNYNHATYLPRRLESIFNQGYRDFEVILMDDRSTDHSVAVLKTYADRSQVSHLILNDVNSGSPFVQWKKGLQRSKGKFIWVAESDDFIDDTFLTKATKVIDADREIGIVYAHSVVVDENDNKIRDLYYDEISPTRWRSDYVTGGREETIEALSIANTIANTSSVLIRKELLERHIDAIASFRSTGDWYLWLLALNDPNVKVAYLSSVNNYFRIHQQTTRGTGKINFGYVNEYFRCLNFAKSAGLIRSYHRLSKKTLEMMLMSSSVKSFFTSKAIRSILSWSMKDSFFPSLILKVFWSRMFARL